MPAEQGKQQPGNIRLSYRTGWKNREKSLARDQRGSKYCFYPYGADSFADKQASRQSVEEAK